MSDSEVKEIIAAVGSHIRLPADEEPLIATIADIELLLEREPFYQGAKNGDLLLLYPKAGKAILFDRDANIIINVGPIILDDDAAATAEETPTEESTETATDTEATTE